jgi:hypothetical protein
MNSDTYFTKKDWIKRKLGHKRENRSNLRPTIAKEKQFLKLFDFFISLNSGFGGTISWFRLTS